MDIKTPQHQSGTAPVAETNSNENQPAPGPKETEAHNAGVKQLLLKTLSIIAQWFVPVVGLIYACGFLIVFTFFKTFGINGTEFFQAKYIHVGSLFLMACIVCLLPLMWFTVTLRVYTATKKPDHAAFGLSLLVFSIMLIMFFIAVAFAPRGFFEDHPTLLALTCGIPLLFVIVDYIGVFFVEGARSRIILVFKQIAAVVELGLAMFTLSRDGLNTKLGDLLWKDDAPKGAVYFLIFMVLIFFYGKLMINRFQIVGGDLMRRVNILVSACCLIGVFLYLAMLTFAYGIYPYVPCTKGGGDYTEACPVKIFFKQELANALPPQVLADLASTNNPLILLDNNPTSIFLVSTNDAGGPSVWQGSLTHRPAVYEIRRDAVTSISYITNRVSNKP